MENVSTGITAEVGDIESTPLVPHPMPLLKVPLGSAGGGEQEGDGKRS